MVSVIGVMLIITTALAFEALLYGSVIAEESIPDFTNQPVADCSGGSGFFGFLTDIPKAIGCAITYVFNFFKSMYGVVVFAFNLVTFNVPGAPWYVRAPLVVAFGGSILMWAASLIRGRAGSEV